MLVVLGPLRRGGGPSTHLVPVGATLGFLGASASLAILGALGGGSGCLVRFVLGATLGLLGANATLAILGAFRQGDCPSPLHGGGAGASLGFLGAEATLAFLGALHVRYGG